MFVFEADLSRPSRWADLDPRGTSYRFPSCSISSVVYLHFPCPGSATGFPRFSTRVE